MSRVANTLGLMQRLGLVPAGQQIETITEPDGGSNGSNGTNGAVH
jgi:hypothetical protein